MQRSKWFGTGLCLAVGLVVLLVGCAQKTPLEQMIENRARYSADINGFYVDARPVIADLEQVDGDVEGDVESEGEEAEEPMEGEEAAEVEVVQTAHIDIIVKHDSFEKLPGVTVDLVQVDSNLNEKGRWRVYFETANIERANPTQFSYSIEAVDYVEGDGFTAEVRHPIPEAERGGYREFSEVVQ